MGTFNIEDKCLNPGGGGGGGSLNKIYQITPK